MDTGRVDPRVGSGRVGISLPLSYLPSPLPPSPIFHPLPYRSFSPRVLSLPARGLGSRDMTGNGCLHSHSLPLPCYLFPFLPIPIPIFHLFPLPYYSHREFPFLPIPIGNPVPMVISTGERRKLLQQVWEEPGR